MLALAGLAIALPPSAHSYVEVIMDALTNAFKKKESTNDWIKVFPPTPTPNSVFLELKVVSKTNSMAQYSR